MINVGDAADKISFLKVLYQEICLGFSEFSYSGKPIFIKHFTEIEYGELNKYKQKYAIEAVQKGLPSRDDKLALLIQEGAWEESKEEQIKNYKREISDLDLVLKNLVIKSQIAKTKDSIRKAKDKLKVIIDEKMDALGYCVEDYVDKKYNEDFIYYSFYKDKKLDEKFFSEEEFYELADSDLQALIRLLNEFYERFSTNQVKRITACSFLMNIYHLSNDNPYYFYGKFVKDLTTFQANLFSQAKYFKNLVSSRAESSPPEDVAEDPDKMIEWYDSIGEVTTNNVNQEDGALGVGHTGASQSELQKMAGGSAKSITDVAMKKGGKLNKEDFLKMHGI